MRIADHFDDKPFVSLEFFPPKEESGWDPFLRTVETCKAADPLFVSVTCGAGGTARGNTLPIADRIQNDLDLEVLVHQTCVGASKDDIDRETDRIREIGVRNVLALRGDLPEGQEDAGGHFEHASDLVAHLKSRDPELGVAVAGYPEPHPASATKAEDLYWQKVKLNQGADFLSTQLFFDNRLYFDLVERLRGMGCEKPVLPGLLPVVSFNNLRRILTLCGASVPGKLFLDFEKAHQEGGDEAVAEMGRELAMNQARDLIAGGAPGVHIFTLNRSAAALRLAEDIRDLRAAA
ncbi:methylenetetrahydrofolate reductase [Desulfohalovibrio reitneri]|uniref:methylenetetrahydrofolate reductase n=1 Tax=Desulfohalovibrio reitneri TaxID=1307759 RepID=UPI0004A756E4|nr:methylenetetrahydrofolate reductase [Desulfohalovibrio reitneri]